eukprot:Seg36.7 transcript_id=Seg36.7/GoldUCD/mRNA.D3Y31 product="hypothetical protein" protein_id=Seg36.7/GoldUCD/D3Y31
MDIVHSLTLTCAYEKGWPSAPPPSPSLGGKRRHLGITPISAVLDRCCEELKEKVDKMDITDGETDNLDFENDLPIKRTRTEYAVTNFYSNCTRNQQFSKEASYGPRPSSNCGENFFIPHVSLGNRSIGSKA